MFRTGPLSKGRLNGLDNLLFHMIFKVCNSVHLNGSTIVQNFIKIALKASLLLKNHKNCSAAGGFAPTPVHDMLDSHRFAQFSAQMRYFFKQRYSKKCKSR